MNRLTIIANSLNKLPWYLIQASAWLLRRLTRYAQLLIYGGLIAEAICIGLHILSLASLCLGIALLGVALTPLHIMARWTSEQPEETNEEEERLGRSNLVARPQ